MSSWRDVPKLRAPDSLTETQKEQILGGNAARLLGLES
jgi:predicted TIM-barrel fold metal-dependent hydrolase